ncbi:hypothetical protein RHSIM_Rhsim09G0157400 [Rhododendron simsii]|uniref:Wall-associated receptor kinase galacturonan-binding domain-containing protein n=1 Tax=Rhododendron simsii TaxID=118357 RepID=A0A834LFC0_RHOSS|nr:hypothetical protein RHSIM_Rhsim09G0157400 [Rhododendron simsii]
MALKPAGNKTLLLLLLLFSVTCSYGNQNQQFFNSCGDINISFPFRLQGDPSYTCNDNDYSLLCDENNRTVLNLPSGKYYVQSINYTDYSIHLVDVGIQTNDICSPFHLFPSTFLYFTIFANWCNKCAHEWATQGFKLGEHLYVGNQKDFNPQIDSRGYKLLDAPGGFKPLGFFLVNELSMEEGFISSSVETMKAPENIFSLNLVGLRLWIWVYNSGSIHNTGARWIRGFQSSKPSTSGIRAALRCSPVKVCILLMYLILELEAVNSDDTVHATRLRGLTMKFDSYKMRPGHTMKQHLRAMSSMIRELKVAGNNLSDEQQVQAVIRSLPSTTAWDNMSQNLTHNENLKTFDDVEHPVTVHCDSMAALAYSKDQKYHGKTKHIDMRYHYIRDMIAQKEYTQHRSTLDSWFSVKQALNEVERLCRSDVVTER